MIAYLRTHVFYIILIVGGLVGFHAWLGEHDARLVADKQEAVSEARVKQLQQQITDVQAAATVKSLAVTKIVSAAKTPEQQIATVPQLQEAPLNVRPVMGEPGSVTVDLPALVENLGKCQQDKIALDACTQTKTLISAQLAEKDEVISALKKKPSFFKRVGSVAKAVGVGIGIGLLLGGHL